MPDIHSNMHVYITSVLGLIGFIVLWLALVESSKVLIALLKNDPLIGWAIGPFGITTLVLCEPSIPFILFSALLPAVISGCILYFGLFSALPSPLALPHHPLIEILVISVGVLFTSVGNILNALRDLRHPLWGEARFLRNIQFLRASFASIHFTSFGISYLRQQFGSNPTDLLQAF
jgi:hypothetical protein